MKKTLGIFTLATILLISGCASSSKAEASQNNNVEKGFNTVIKFANKVYEVIKRGIDNHD